MLTILSYLGLAFLFYCLIFWAIYGRDIAYWVVPYLPPWLQKTAYTMGEYLIISVVLFLIGLICLVGHALT